VLLEKFKTFCHSQYAIAKCIDLSQVNTICIYEEFSNLLINNNSTIVLFFLEYGT